MKYYLVYYNKISKERFVKYFKSEETKEKFKRWLTFNKINKEIYIIIEDSSDIVYY